MYTSIYLRNIHGKESHFLVISYLWVVGQLVQVTCLLCVIFVFTSEAKLTMRPWSNSVKHYLSVPAEIILLDVDVILVKHGRFTLFGWMSRWAEDTQELQPLQLTSSLSIRRKVGTAGLMTQCISVVLLNFATIRNNLLTVTWGHVLSIWNFCLPQLLQKGKKVLIWKSTNPFIRYHIEGLHRPPHHHKTQEQQWRDSLFQVVRMKTQE